MNGNTVLVGGMPAVTVTTGDLVRVTLPWSEVCLHCGWADQVRVVAVLATGVQVLKMDGTPDSFPITHGEAGIYTAVDGSLYAYGELVTERAC